MLDDTKEARPYLAVRREPYSVAMTAKRLGYRRNNPNFTLPALKAPSFGRRRDVPIGHRLQAKRLLEPFEQFTARHYELFEPGTGRIQWHEFNKTHAQAVFLSKGSQGLNFMVVKPADDYRVDLDGVEA